MKRTKHVIGKDPTISIRQCEADDQRLINETINKGSGAGYYKAVFGPFNIANLIDLGILSLIGETIVPQGEDYRSEFRGFISLDDTISLMGDSQNFEPVIQLLQHFLHVTTDNTLFINFWHMEEKANTGFTLIREAFAALPHLEYIVWVCPATFIAANYIDELFSMLDVFTSAAVDEEVTKKCREIFRGLKLYYLSRQDFLPRLAVRNALIEDNDELVPIIQKSNPEILAEGDSYLLADLILKQDTNNRFFVGVDPQQRIQGMLATSLDVNMSLIMKIFDIDAYPDLIIQSEAVPPPPPLLVSLVGDVRLIDLRQLETFLYHQNVLYLNFQSFQQQQSLSELYREAKESLPLFDDSIYPGKSLLFKYCQLLITKQPNPSSLQAVVLLGYPRSEEEALDSSLTIIRDFDVVLELLDDSEDVEEEEEEGLQHHLDSIEVLREHYFKEDDPWLASQRAPLVENLPPNPTSANYGLETAAAYYRPQQKAAAKSKWTKIPLSRDHTPAANNERVYSQLSSCLEERIQRLEAARAIHKEKPPAANAFAITALCLQEDFLSRSLDLVKLSFEEQPHLSYCLYMISNETIPSVALRGFNYIKTRPGISFDQSLYIIHRAFFLVEGHLSVQRVTATDLPPIEDSHNIRDTPSSEDVTNKESEEVGEGVTPNYDLYDYLHRVTLQTERSELLTHLQSSLRYTDTELSENPEEVSFKIILSNRIIGLLVWSRRMLTDSDLHWLRVHYCLDETIAYSRHRLRSQAMITHFCLDPVFSSYSQRVLQLVMRRSHKTILYYHHDRDVIPGKEFIEHFSFVRPRRYPQGSQMAHSTRPVFVDPVTKSVESLPAEDSPLYLITKGQLSRHKQIVSQRVVIVGGSVHSLAFLETLCSVTHLYLPNLYFIVDLLPASFRLTDNPTNSSTNAMVSLEALTAVPSKYQAELSKYDSAQTGCLSPQDGDLPYSSEQWASGIAYRVNVIKGRLTDIDRENKAVVISDELVIEYDYLLLSSWTQDNSARKIPSLQGVHPSKCADAGIFSLGNPSADLLAASWVKKRSLNRSESIAICGTGLKVLTAAEGLIRVGIDPSRLALVINEGDDSIEGCQDLTQNALVSQTAALAGIKQVFWQCTVGEVALSRTGFIHAIELIDLRVKERLGTANSTNTTNSNNHLEGSEENKLLEDPNAIPSHLSVIALLLCGGQDFQSCERDLFAAINDCGLVFDGGLVVDKSFQTVDPRIYAVSDFTKYSRVFRKELPHYRYNPRELGTFAAIQVLYQHLDPLASRYASDILYHRSLSRYQVSQLSKPQASPLTSLEEMKTKVLAFTLPRSVVCQLPGDVMYSASRLPKPSSDTALLVTDNVTGSSVTHTLTGSPPPRRVTALKFDAVGVVQEVVYVGLDFVEFRNLSSLPGLHEAFLNHAIHAYRKGLVEDWIDFFRKDWTAALFLHSFPRLVQTLRHNLLQDKGMMMILNRIFEKSENTVEDTEMAEFRRNLLGACGELLPDLTKKLVGTETYDFVKEYRDFLPHFHLQQQQP